MSSPITHGAVKRSLAIGEFRLTYTDHSPEQTVGPHTHPVAALTIPLYGGFVEVVEDRALECSPGTVLFKAAGARHENRYWERGARSLILEIPCHLLSQLATTMAIRDVVADTVDGVPWSTALRLHRAVREAPDVALTGFQELVCQVVGARPDRAGPSSVQPPGWLDRVRDRIESRLPDTISLPELATDAGVHPVYLARAFRRHYGCSIGECALRHRIDHAVLALIRTDEPVAQIASRLGFYDQPHLTRQFQRLTGTTPARFRRLAAQP